MNILFEKEAPKHHSRFRNGLLLVTFAVMVVVATSGVVYSLFSKPFDLAAIYEDVPVVQEVQVVPTPKPIVERSRAAKRPRPTQATQQPQALPARPQPPAPTFNPTAIPPTTATRMPRDYTIPDNVFDGRGAGGDFRSSGRNSGNDSGADDGNSSGSNELGDENTGKKSGNEVGPPPPPPTPKPTPKAETKPISLGVINGKAKNLVQPTQTSFTRGITGKVMVFVHIDENGNVTAASATSGPIPLRAVAASAARRSTFTPTLLSLKPVKITGFIEYNFK